MNNPRVWQFLYKVIWDQCFEASRSVTFLQRSGISKQTYRLLLWQWFILFCYCVTAQVAFFHVIKQTDIFKKFIAVL